MRGIAKQDNPMKVNIFKRFGVKGFINHGLRIIVIFFGYNDFQGRLSEHKTLLPMNGHPYVLWQQRVRRNGLSIY
jgi:hypothetical protein